MLTEADYIAEALVHGEIDGKSGDTVVKAEIYPDYEQIKKDLGKLKEEEIEGLIKRVVNEVCDTMPAYKRVTRIGIRTVEFEKTTTRKVKRHAEANKSKK